MAEKRQLVSVVFLFSIIGFVIYLSFKLRDDEDDEIRANHYEVVGLVSNVGMKTIDVSYEIDDKTYTYTRNKPYSGIVAGEEFHTLASKKNKSRAIVLFTNPVLNSKKYKYSKLKPIEINKLITNSDALSFTYKISSEEYDRIQVYEDGKRPENTEKLKVRYRIDRPEISYLTE